MTSCLGVCFLNLLINKSNIYKSYRSTVQFYPNTSRIRFSTDEGLKTRNQTDLPRKSQQKRLWSRCSCWSCDVSQIYSHMNCGNVFIEIKYFSILCFPVAKVGKTSLIMCLVGEEFPEQVSLPMSLSGVCLSDAVRGSSCVCVARFLSERRRSPYQPTSRLRKCPHI